MLPVVKVVALTDRAQGVYELRLQAVRIRRWRRLWGRLCGHTWSKHVRRMTCEAGAHGRHRLEPVRVEPGILVRFDLWAGRVPQKQGTSGSSREQSGIERDIPAGSPASGTRAVSKVGSTQGLESRHTRTSSLPSATASAAPVGCTCDSVSREHVKAKRRKTHSVRASPPRPSPARLSEAVALVLVGVHPLLLEHRRTEHAGDPGIFVSCLAPARERCERYGELLLGGVVKDRGRGCLPRCRQGRGASPVSAVLRQRD